MTWETTPSGRPKSPIAYRLLDGDRIRAYVGPFGGHWEAKVWTWRDAADHDWRSFRRLDEAQQWAEIRAAFAVANGR